jgi:hypothetical protein
MDVDGLVDEQKLSATGTRSVELEPTNAVLS